MGETSRELGPRVFTAELSRAGEARHFVAWLGASSGLRGGALGDLAVAAEALLTDVFLSCADEGGTIEIGAAVSEDEVKITVCHPELLRRRMAGLDEVMSRFLDGHETSTTRAVLVKRLG